LKVGGIVTGDIEGRRYCRFGDIVTGDIVTGDIVTGDIVTGDIVTGDIVTGGIVDSEIFNAGDIVDSEILLIPHFELACHIFVKVRYLMCLFICLFLIQTQSRQYF
jgi:hypothetical protein